MKFFSKLFATWFGLGYMPVAPGTWGSLGAIPFVYFMRGINPWFFLITVIGFIGFSILVSEVYEQATQKHDPSQIVIDEVAGIFVTMLFVPFTWLTMLLGFILFRLFDITKPWPVNSLDKTMKGGAGTVLDDVFAGVYASIALHIIYNLIIK